MGLNRTRRRSTQFVTPELANSVKRYIAGQDFKKSTYLFQTSRRERCGFQIFRRFRASWRRKNRAPWVLEKMWMGHAHKDLMDQYAEQLREDVKYRRECREKIGLGFFLPTNVSQLS